MGNDKNNSEQWEREHYALPMAKQFLKRDDLQFPLQELEHQQLQEAILAQLESLHQKGYTVEPWKSPYDK